MGHLIKASDDALQRRIAGFIRKVDAPRSIRGIQDLCLGSTIGNVRSENQDRALIAIATYPESPERNFVLGIVCDGMGGLVRGDEAATLSVSVFVSRVIRTARLPMDERLKSGALAANDAVYENFRGSGGATLAAVFISSLGAVVGINAGDSRIYSLSSSRGKQQLSCDDTMAALLGGPNGSEANKNRLVQFIGMGEGLEPHLIRKNRNDFDSVLLTSDGVHGVPADALDQVIRAPSSSNDLVRRLIELSELLGGRDNATAVFLSTHYEFPPVDIEQGLNLTFLSGSDRVEIWIPILAEESRHHQLPPSLIEASAPVEESQPRKNRKGAKAPPRKQSKRKSRGTAEGTLPLEKPDPAPLEIRFPEKSGS